ncbi:MAG TPA: twin-arginine translocation signal domain-containing protein [Kofleriaceae bacterium]|nr:twin-arginine translocation signal domain-containing protein [Kofleriaceae bacterium]
MISRRNFLRGGLAGIGAAAAASALSPLVKIKRAHAAGNGKRVVLVGIGGGLRLRESLGMAEGATMPNLFGTVPLIAGFGTSAGAPRIAPEYAQTARPLVLPPVRSTPLHTQGSLITNLRYADGPPGHLQGHGCLLSGFYNKLENRADAHLPVPTIFELHRREANAPASDAWYLSVVGGFYRALITSDSPDYGARYAGVYLQPPGVMQPLVPIITSGKRTLELSAQSPDLPTIPSNPAEDAAAARLTGVLDGNTAPYAAEDPNVHLASDDNARIQAHLAEIYSDPTYGRFFPDSFGIGLRANDGGVDSTNDALTIFHAERVLEKFRPAVMAITLLDVDVCHSDFNGYLRNQQIADACVAHLWDFIQSIPELRDTTTMIVLPEHGRHLFFNGNNPDSLQRSGIDHGQGDDGDRDIWMLALGPDIKPNQVIAPTNISQPGRTSGRYETIDAVMTAMHALGHDTRLASELSAFGARPGLVIDEVQR